MNSPRLRFPLIFVCLALLTVSLGFGLVTGVPAGIAKACFVALLGFTACLLLRQVKAR